MKTAKLAIAALFVTYPFIVYFGLSSFGAQGIALCLLVLVAVRLWFFRRDQNSSPLLWGLLASVLLVAFASATTLILRTSEPLLFYPVAMNLVMLVLFGMTLRYPPSMIERIARLREASLPAQAIGYTRVVTQIWCVFFVINGAIALYTAVIADLAVWTLYNGMISYVLMAILFAGEFIVRKFVQRQNQAASDVP